MFEHTIFQNDFFQERGFCLTTIFMYKMFVLTDTRTCEDCKDILEELEKVMTRKFSEFCDWF